MTVVIIDPDLGEVQSTATQVVLLGRGPSGSDVAVPPGAEVWGVNEPPRRDHPPYTRAFQMHPPEILLDRERNWLVTCPVPIYVLDRTAHGFVAEFPEANVSEINPRAVTYPLQRILDTGLPSLFASSFDYMLALAICEGFQKIIVAGADQQIGRLRERLCEHVTLAWWAGFAAGRGIGLHVQSASLKFPYRYGYDFDAERTWAQRMCFWASLVGLNLEGFDDGAATTGVQGWDVTVSHDEVRVKI